jgi:hypothetical protein
MGEIPPRYWQASLSFRAAGEIEVAVGFDEAFWGIIPVELNKSLKPKNNFYCAKSATWHFKFTVSEGTAPGRNANADSSKCFWGAGSSDL